jgi:hypothetical protein
MGTRSFQGVESGRGVTLTPHPLLVMKEYLYLYSPYGPYGLYRALSACTRVTFTFLPIEVYKHNTTKQLKFYFGWTTAILFTKTAQRI